MEYPPFTERLQNILFLLERIDGQLEPEEHDSINIIQARTMLLGTFARIDALIVDMKEEGFE